MLYLKDKSLRFWIDVNKCKDLMLQLVKIETLLTFSDSCDVDFHVIFSRLF